MVPAEIGRPWVFTGPARVSDLAGRLRVLGLDPVTPEEGRPCP